MRWRKKKNICNWRTRVIGRDGDNRARFVICMWEPDDIWISQRHEDDQEARLIIGVNDIPLILDTLKMLADADRTENNGGPHELVILEEWPRLVVYHGKNGRIYLSQDPGHGHNRRSFIYIDPGYDFEAVRATLAGLQQEVLTE